MFIDLPSLLPCRGCPQAQTHGCACASMHRFHAANESGYRNNSLVELFGPGGPQFTIAISQQIPITEARMIASALASSQRITLTAASVGRFPSRSQARCTSQPPKRFRPGLVRSRRHLPQRRPPFALAELSLHLAFSLSSWRINAATAKRTSWANDMPVSAATLSPARRRCSGKRIVVGFGMLFGIASVAI